jgi:hypothetical protein
MESGNIKRVQPEAAIPIDAVRRAAARRQRGGREQDFSDELTREGEPRGSDAPGEQVPHEDLPFTPPEDGEAGTRIDLVG